MKIKCKCIIEIEKTNFTPLDGSPIYLNITKWNRGRGFGELEIDIHEEEYNGIVGETIKFETIVVDAQPDEYSEETRMTSFNNIGRSRVATVVPPSNIEDNAIRFQKQEETEETFKDFKEVFEKKVSKKSDFIYNLDGFINELNICKNKKSNINPEKEGDDSPRGKMKKSLAMEQKIGEESLDSPCWIMNTAAAILTINDLPLDLHLNFPKNITGKFTARQLLNSTSLFSLIKKGQVVFISPDEAKKIFENQNKIDKKNQNDDIIDRKNPKESRGDFVGEGSEDQEDADEAGETEEYEDDFVSSNQNNSAKEIETEEDSDFASIDLTSKKTNSSNNSIKTTNSRGINKATPVRAINRK